MNAEMEKKIQAMKKAKEVYHLATQACLHPFIYPYDFTHSSLSSFLLLRAGPNYAAEKDAHVPPTFAAQGDTQTGRQNDGNIGSNDQIGRVDHTCSKCGKDGGTGRSAIWAGRKRK